jgi:2-hydroxy-3-keto-5-methylthiopentenyl-1-phosphate phosphatase
MEIAVKVQIVQAVLLCDDTVSRCNPEAKKDLVFARDKKCEILR